MKSEPTNLARKTPLPQSQISDTSLNGAGDGGSYVPVVGDSPTYNPSAGLPNDMITSKGLNSNETAGVITPPSFSGGMPDNMIQASQPVTNAEAVGELNITASEENRSAQWKRGESIGRTAGVPEKGRNQYDTPQ